MKRSIDKGKRLEREAARLLGWRRVPLSGAAAAAGEEYAGDLVAPNGWRAQVKGQANGFRRLYRWLEGHDVLLLKADRKPFLAVLPASTLRELIDRAGLMKEVAHGQGRAAAGPDAEKAGPGVRANRERALAGVRPRDGARGRHPVHAEGPEVAPERPGHPAPTRDARQAGRG